MALYWKPSCSRSSQSATNAWWWLLYLTVIGTIPLVAFWMMDSVADNQYGPDPAAVGGRQQYQQRPPPAAPQF